MGRMFSKIIPVLLGVLIGVFFGDTIKEKLNMNKDKTNG